MFFHNRTASAAKARRIKTSAPAPLRLLVANSSGKAVAAAVRWLPPFHSRQLKMTTRQNA
ncbi:hypothetical protein B0X71_02595 [Planococcus lenghuensis]|uniref:Uncharacterized protein n=1 Tax=Planococcus lenghuensis TaxID=2213202 RepID=A0A1Q2KV96_9BACL|nr:hypothetical protein B0X71_02595 [Planococcus lenghuensis]